MNDVDLAIRLTADAEQASRAVDGVGDSFNRMASDVDDASAKTEAAGSRLDGVADSADNVASRSSQAAGGIGDLAGALAATGVISEGTAAAMETGAAAIMGVTGAADILNLVTTSNIVVQAKQRAAAIATAVATRAQAAATRTAAVAQRVLNVAMRANPVGLVITAVLILVGLFVLLYKRSETFRRIVQAVMGAARAAVQRVIGIVGDLVGWFRDRAPAAAAALRDRVVTVATGIRDAFGRALDWVRDKWSSAIRFITELVGDIRGKVSDAASSVRSVLGGAFDWVRDKVQPIIDAVEWIVDKLNNIRLPSNPFGRVAAVPVASTPGAVGTASGAGYGPGTVVNIRVEGAVDADSTARQIVRLLEQRAGRTGVQVIRVGA